jgi:hypothetical protein
MQSTKAESKSVTEHKNLTKKELEILEQTRKLEQARKKYNVENIQPPKSKKVPISVELLKNEFVKDVSGVFDRITRPVHPKRKPYAYGCIALVMISFVAFLEGERRRYREMEFRRRAIDPKITGGVNFQ